MKDGPERELVDDYLGRAQKTGKSLGYRGVEEVELNSSSKDDEGQRLLAKHGKGILIKKALASGHACLAEGVDPVRASFELIFAHPGVSSAIVGTITPAHLAANVATVAAVLQGIR